MNSTDKIQGVFSKVRVPKKEVSIPHLNHAIFRHQTKKNKK
jgi:hypothetical protein